MRIWNATSSELLASMVSTSDDEWLAITPEGFFVGSEKGAELLSMVRGLQLYSTSQVYQMLHRPDLVREKLAGDPNGKVREAAAGLDLNKVLESGAPPLVPR